MPVSLFVGGLVDSITDAALTEAFRKYGDVERAKVVTHKETSQSRGFGFVTFAGDSAEADAKAAMEKLTMLEGKKLNINLSSNQDNAPSRQRPPTSMNARGGAAAVQFGVENGLDDPENANKAKVAIARRQRPKVTEDMLNNPARGLQKLQDTFDKIKFKGKGHEAADARLLMSVYHKWADDLVPALTFKDFYLQSEKVGSKRAVQSTIEGLRAKKFKHYLLPYYDPSTDDRAGEAILDANGEEWAAPDSNVLPPSAPGYGLNAAIHEARPETRLDNDLHDFSGLAGPRSRTNEPDSDEEEDLQLNTLTPSKTRPPVEALDESEADMAALLEIETQMAAQMGAGGQGKPAMDDTEEDDEDMQALLEMEASQRAPSTSAAATSTAADKRQQVEEDVDDDDDEDMAALLEMEASQRATSQPSQQTRGQSGEDMAVLLETEASQRKVGGEAAVEESVDLNGPATELQPTQTEADQEDKVEDKTTTDEMVGSPDLELKPIATDVAADVATETGVDLNAESTGTDEATPM